MTTQTLFIVIPIALMGALFTLWFRLYFTVRDLVGGDAENNLRNIQRMAVEGIVIQNNIKEVHELIDCINKENDKILPRQKIKPHWSFRFAVFFTIFLFIIIIVSAFTNGGVPYTDFQVDDANRTLLAAFIPFYLYTFLYMFENYRRWVDIRRADRKYGNSPKQKLLVVLEQENEN